MDPRSKEPKLDNFSTDYVLIFCLNLLFYELILGYIYYFTLVQSDCIPSHSSLNIGISANSLKLSRNNSRDIPNELVMFLYDSRTNLVRKWIEFAIFLKLFIINPVGYERFESNSKYLREYLCTYVSICVDQICCAGIFPRRISLFS